MFELKQNRALVKPAVIVTLFTFLSLLIGLATQAVIAWAFGATLAFDAYLVASTFPHYVIAVLMNALNVVFIPVFAEHMKPEHREKAWQAAHSVIALFLLVSTTIVVLGAIFSAPLLRLTAPGLSQDTLRLATLLSFIVWPTIIATGLSSLLIGIYQVHGNFSWPAAVPCMGATITLLLVIVLARFYNIFGFAIASSVGIFLQLALLWPILKRSSISFQFKVNWQHPVVHQVVKLSIPLLIAGFVERYTPIVDRFLASELGAGNISHLNYALRLVTTISTLVTTGIVTTLFPKMALEVATENLHGFRNTISVGARAMWLFIAPLVTIGAALSLPFITLLLERGNFTHGDSVHVSVLFQIYLVALFGMALGGVTSRAFYVLKKMRLIAVASVLEGVAYLFYAVALGRRFGAEGIAWAYVIHFSASIVWQLLYLHLTLGSQIVKSLWSSAVRTSIAALLSGGVAWVIASRIASPWLSFVTGGIASIMLYFLILYWIESDELHFIWDTIKAKLRSMA